SWAGARPGIADWSAPRRGIASADKSSRKRGFIGWDAVTLGSLRRFVTISSGGNSICGRCGAPCHAPCGGSRRGHGAWNGDAETGPLQRGCVYVVIAHVNALRRRELEL